MKASTVALLAAVVACTTHGQDVNGFNSRARAPSTNTFRTGASYLGAGGFDTHARAPSTNTFRKGANYLGAGGFDTHARAPSTNTFRRGQAALSEEDPASDADHRLRWALFSDADGLVATGDDETVVYSLLAKANALDAVKSPSLMADNEDEYVRDDASVYLDEYADETENVASSSSEEDDWTANVLLELRDALSDIIQHNSGAAAPRPPRLLRHND